MHERNKRANAQMRAAKIPRFAAWNRTPLFDFGLIPSLCTDAASSRIVPSDKLIHRFCARSRCESFK